MKTANFGNNAAWAFAFAYAEANQGHPVKLEKVAGNWRVIFSPVKFN
jgi:hypothetical protein